MAALGIQFGNYEVLEALGAGGMGEVYRARDSRLGRDVAIKILSERFKLDATRLARFEREARVLASLNHPNIATLHAVEQFGDAQALVLELVEGRTLADRIARGPIPLPEALGIARQIAAALEAAHEQGVVHRDIKPSNIKLRPDGTVKLLDFGLAKIIESDAAGADPYKVTVTAAPDALGGGMLGTPAYMSPEQARGLQVDKRSDIWAFGCVLYEMITAQPAFKAAHTSDVIAKIIEREPDFELLPRQTPAAVARLLRSCLRKNPRERLRDIGDAVPDLTPVASVGKKANVALLRWAGLAALLMVAGGAAWWVKTNEGGASRGPLTQDVEAYQRYLQAGSLMDEAAIDLLSQAVALDPHFSQAYAKLAAAHISLYMRGRAAKNLALAQQFAHKALESGPNATAQFVLGEYSYLAGEWLDMDARDSAALAMDAADARLFARRSVHLLSVGKISAAVTTAQHAYDMAPANPRMSASLARTLFVQGKQSEAIKFADLAITLGLPQSEVGYIHARSARDAADYARSAELINATFAGGDVEHEVKEEFERAVRTVHAALADPAKRPEALALVQRTYPGPYTASGNPVALVKRCMVGIKWYVLLHAMDEAFALAMRCPDIGNGMAAGATMENSVADLWGPEMRPFRQDPRFQRFTARIGLMEFWKRKGPPDDCNIADGKLTCH